MSNALEVFEGIEIRDNFQITIDLNKASKHSEKDAPPRSQISRHNEINVEELQINQEYSLLRPTIHRSMSKENNTSDVQKAQTNNWAFECKDCDKIFTGVESQEDHFKSKKHLEKVSAITMHVLLQRKEDVQNKSRHLFTLND